jgi:hypothetical protein
MWLVLLLFIQGCTITHTRTTTVDFMLPVWFGQAPPDWVPPPKYEHCKVLDAVVLENGEPMGLPTVRVECPKEMIWFHRDTKKIVQIRRWN